MVLCWLKGGIYSNTPTSAPQHFERDTFLTQDPYGHIFGCVNLQDALDGTVAIVDGDVPFADTTRSRASFRVLVEGYATFTKMPNISQRSTTKPGVRIPKPRQQIVVEIAKVALAFIGWAQTTTQSGPWRFGPGHIELRHLYVAELLHVTEGSYQPVLWVDVPEAVPAPETPQIVVTPEPSSEDVVMSDEPIQSTWDAMSADIPAVQAPTPISWNMSSAIQDVLPELPHVLSPALPGTRAPPPSPMAGLPFYTLNLTKIDVKMHELLVDISTVCSEPDVYLNAPGDDWSVMNNLIEETDPIPFDMTMEDVLLHIPPSFPSMYHPPSYWAPTPLYDLPMYAPPMYDPPMYG